MFAEKVIPEKRVGLIAVRAAAAAERQNLKRQGWVVQLYIWVSWGIFDNCTRKKLKESCCSSHCFFYISGLKLVRKQIQEGGKIALKTFKNKKKFNV
jgi:hypothetical protein